MGKDHLCTNEELHKGDFLTSCNGAYKAIFQDDGNFVIYDCCCKPVWASDTYGTCGVRLILQGDGNLVIYNPCDKPLWATDTNTPESHTCRLDLTNDGRLVLMRHCQEIWNSGCSKGRRC